MVSKKRDFTADLVLCFASRSILEQGNTYEEVREKYPAAHIIHCSTAGEIANDKLFDNSIICTAVGFEHSRLHVCDTSLLAHTSSFLAGVSLGGQLPLQDLVHVTVFSDGLLVNGSELIKGLQSKLPHTVGITGGLAGDGADFAKTLVGLNQSPVEGTIVAIGFYGNKLRVGYGCVGGWDSFGPERLITKSEENCLYELDGLSSLSLYKKYLGDMASGLPGTSLLFPLSIRSGETRQPIVRTVSSVDESRGAMIFAGNIPQGAYARIMKANIENLIEGAGQAALNSYDLIGEEEPEFALLISCVGRRRILQDRIDEELNSVRKVLGNNTLFAGFYSYGEISPLWQEANRCELHNQTMTITTFREVN